ncbi:glucokinase [Dokdonella sp.]|uniref:glucokinase n=1 Tax=Dokdonella sp. TaxID=2291710 RepID=UPI001B1A7905|nr:glucokinase [Dokdonella sp.]MBO9661878.1 glucokinase [Dokdonella sp.]
MGSEPGQRVLASAPTAPLIAADVGGTHARVALIDAADAAFAVARYEKYACGDFASLDAIIAAFRDAHVQAPVECVALAIAGYVIDDAVVNLSLPWPVSISGLRDALGLRELAIVNDFEAAAHALGHLGADDVSLLSGPAHAAEGPLLLVGPGTGLGAAVRIPHPHRVLVLATEAGQATLAPDSELEFALLRELRARGSRVLIEDVMSGTGLANLHAAVRALRGAPPSALTPAQITAAALERSDAHAIEAVEVFCGWFGSVLGDLALLYGATGGVYLAGGVLPQMKPLLLQSRFVERFLDKGVMREVLARTPVRLVEHARLGVIGAASWFLERDSSRRDSRHHDSNTRRAVGADTPAGTAAPPSKDRQDPASGAQRTRQRTTT